jgi:sporulation protein YlmC with PRC-barrel domain
MDTNATTVTSGMDVLDSTGEKVGTVADVLTLAAYSQSAQTDPYATTDSAAGDYGSGASDGNTVLKVNQGGVLGIGAKELYIPMSDVQSIQPGDSVTINCAQAQFESLYSQKPSFLDNV